MNLDEENVIDEIRKRSLEFFDTIYPKELIAKTVEEIKDPNSVPNQFVEQIHHCVNFNDHEEVSSFIFFQAGISTYTSCSVQDLAVDHPIVKGVYQEILDKLNQ